MEELNAEVGSQKNSSQNRFNKSKSSVKKITDSNNAKNRDIQSRMKAQGRLMYLSNENMSTVFDNKNEVTGDDVEDAMIDYIDNKRNPITETED